jgi:hypothetical protein
MGVSLKTKNEECARKTMQKRAAKAGGEVSMAPPWRVFNGKFLGSPPPASPIA